MYHAHGISKAAISAAGRRVTDRGGTQHIASSANDFTATYCVTGPQRAGGFEEDPTLTEIGSQREKDEP